MGLQIGDMRQEGKFDETIDSFAQHKTYVTII